MKSRSDLVFFNMTKPKSIAPSATPGKPSATRWQTTDEQLLVDWLTTYPNYQRYKNAGVPDAQGVKRSSGATKVSIAEIISKSLETRGSFRSGKQIKAKIAEYEKKYRETATWLDSTGEGVLTVDEKLENEGIEAATNKRFRYFSELNPVFGERAGNRPAHVEHAGVINPTGSMTPPSTMDAVDVDAIGSPDPDKNLPPVSPDVAHRNTPDDSDDGEEDFDAFVEDQRACELSRIGEPSGTQLPAVAAETDFGKKRKAEAAGGKSATNGKRAVVVTRESLGLKESFAARMDLERERLAVERADAAIRWAREDRNAELDRARQDRNAELDREERRMEREARLELAREEAAARKHELELLKLRWEMERSR
ncbi:hypothetical protein HKX48_006707 [Thoreauomyces humboldtii]|nr:hypothetical protein HKX48_006707 [Thoreauomyces humboldtii]